MKAEFVLILFTLPSAVLAQTRQPPKPDSLLYRTRKGDDSALSEMEKSSDVQDLQTLLHAPNSSGKSATPIFLAKMGDHEALQYFACQSLTKWPRRNIEAPNGL